MAIRREGGCAGVTVVGRAVAEGAKTSAAKSAVTAGVRGASCLWDAQ
jgi:hypothetical protein